MLDAWTKAALLEPPLICGRRLLPLSAAHAVTLSAIGCPVWCGGKAGPADVLVAVHVLSMTWRECRAWLAAGAKVPSLWAACWMLRRKSMRNAEASLLDYLEDATHCPTHKQAADGDGCKAPWQWHIAAGLMRLGMTEDEAWNHPINRASCVIDAHGEREGADSLVDEKTARGMELVAQANAEPDADKRQAMYAEAEALLKR